LFPARPGETFGWISHNSVNHMSRIFGFFIGFAWLGLAFGAFQRAQGGWARDHPDVGVWWSVIAGFLGIAALGAFIGTWLHTRPGRR